LLKNESRHNIHNKKHVLYAEPPFIPLSRRVNSISPYTTGTYLG